MRTSLHLLTGLLLVALAHASDSLALAAADDDNAHDFLKLAGSPSPQSDPSQRTRAIQLPVLQKRSSAGYGCGM